MPKLTRQLACGAALSTRLWVRSRSPAPTTTEKPAERAIFASAARPEVHRTAFGTLRMPQPPPFPHTPPAARSRLPPPPPPPGREALQPAAGHGPARTPCREKPLPGFT